MINLLGCQDAHKCTFRDIDLACASIPVMDFENKDAYDERMFAETVTVDDPRITGSAAARIEPLRRSAQLKDWLQGAEGCSSKTAIVRTVTGLHRFCWKCLQQLDVGLGLLVDALRRAGRLEEAIVYVYSDHAIGLYEHGELCEAPWDACLRTFLIRRVPGRPKSTHTTPLSLANFATMLFEDCNISADWHMNPAPSNACVTIGIALSWLARAHVDPVMSVFDLRTFFVRTIVHYNARYYAIIQWFSLQDLIDAAGDDNFADPDTKAKAMHARQNWPNPVFCAPFDELRKRCALQMYDLQSDPDERWNLADDEHWIGATLATRLGEEVKRASTHHKLDTLTLHIPANVHVLSPEHVTFCSVQLHARIRARVHKKASPPQRRLVNAMTQTEEAQGPASPVGSTVSIASIPSSNDEASSGMSSSSGTKPGKTGRASRANIASTTRGNIRAREFARRPGG